MPTPHAWIVCEHSGHWAAALRVALTRQAAEGTIAPRIFEARSLAELTATIGEHAAALALVEVRSDNLAPVLDLLTSDQRHTSRYVALLDQSLGQSAGPHAQDANALNPNRQMITDALWEAGVADVFTSPRQMHAVLELRELHSAASAKLSAPGQDLASIAKRAWASLPWQDG